MQERTFKFQEAFPIPIKFIKIFSSCDHLTSIHQARPSDVALRSLVLAYPAMLAER